MDLQAKSKERNPVEERFTISYDAKQDILESHQIDAKDLGEAIVGLHSLIEDTARIISNGSAEVKLKVTTPAKEGSLEVVFALLSDSATIIKVLGTLGLAHAATFAGSTVIELIQQIKNRKITSIVIESDSEEATIHTENGSFTANKDVARLVSDAKIRESLYKVIQAPLAGKPDATFKVLDAKHQEVQKITTEEIKEFSRLPKGSLEEVSTETKTITVTFSQVNFGSRKGWKILIPDGTEHSVVLEDAAFLEKVTKNQQAFLKDDRYEVKLKTTTTYRPSRNTVDRAIVEVLRNWDAQNRGK